MIKLYLLIRRKPGISKEQFRDYYESTHAKLAARTFPMFHSYVRRYLADTPFPQPDDLDYDVVTELGFASEADYQAFKAVAARPDVLETIRADEANFLVSDATRMFVIEEHGA